MFVSLSDKYKTVESYYRDHFVELPGPSGGDGKKIFIDRKVVDNYAKLLSSISRNFNTLYFYKQIASLKNIGSLSGLVSKKTVLSRRLALEGGAIQYAIWHGRVYITQIEIQADYRYEKGKRNIPAGLYRVEKTSGERGWSCVNDKGGIADKSIVNTKNLAINGACRDIEDAASYMPAFIQYGFGETALTNTYSLFFNPAQGLVRSGWRALRDSSGIGGTQAAKKLADLLTLAGNKDKEIQLTVHEQGHALLKEALRRVCQDRRTLSNVTVFYANPTQNLELVDRLRARAGMRLATKAPLINSVSASQNLATGNFISGAVVAGRADRGNSVSHAYNGVAFAVGTVSLGGVASGLTPLGAAGWALGAAPFLLGMAGGMNKKVIINSGQAVQEGVKGVKKLVWDPVHKMMVRA